MAKPGEQGVLYQWIDIVKQKCDGKNKLQGIYKELSQLTTDRDRFNFIWSLEDVQHAAKRLKTNIPKEEKSDEASETSRLEGNTLFQKARYTEALEKYNESVLTASPVAKGGNEKGKTLALAIACRSAALFHLKHYEDCMKDIGTALKHGYPKNLEYKLRERKGRCLSELGRFYEASLEFEGSLEYLNQSNLDEVKYKEWTERITTIKDHCMLMCNNNNVIQTPDTLEMSEKHDHLQNKGNRDCFKMGESNDTFTNLSKKCNVMHTDSRGRHIIADADIYPGDVIVTEEPYAHILLTDYIDTHCHHCLSPLGLSVTPCDSCSLVRFCGRSCQMTSCSTYHKHECLVLNALLSCGVDKFGLLALRVLTKTSYQELYMDTQEEPPTGEGNYNNGFRAVSRLVTHSADRTGEDLFQRGLIAIFITHILRPSSFLQTASAESGLPLEEVALITGSWLLTLLQLLPCNAHSISELGLRPKAVFESSPHDIGAGIYATLSLFNHSCDPGLTRSFLGPAVVSTAVKLIRQGEEVCDNYGAVYAIQGVGERQGALRPQYFFSCWCEACVNDWPQCSHPSAFSPPGWRCESCGHLLGPAGQPRKKTRKKRRKTKKKCPEDSEGKQHEVRSGEITESSLSDIRVCNNCKLSQTVSNKLKALKDSGGPYLRALDLLRAGEAGKALPDLLTHLRTVEETVAHPWRDHVMCQEAVKQCYSLLANCREVRS